jgi:F-type H+-transporting ATPase subunit delta
LSNPTINEEKKKELLKRIASESGFDKYTLNFLNLLVDQGRIEAIQEICDAFETRYCDLTETQVAVLRSAVKLEQEQQFLIAKKLQELTGSKNIKLKPVIDESLIAGFIVEWGSSQIDLSVKGQLDKISGELVSSANLAASS